MAKKIRKAAKSKGGKAKKQKAKISKKPVKAASSKKLKALKNKVKQLAKKKKFILKKGPYMVYLGLGSNVGDREEYIEQAIFLLNKVKGIDVIKHSSNYETEPEGETDQPSFINAAVQIKTTLTPQKLLTTINEIETALGREREVEWGPRTIDIDIIFFDDVILSEDSLQIPHPLAHERMFVLIPIKEISPNFVHPVLEKTVQDLYDEKKTDAGATYDDDLPGFKEIKQGTYDDFERW